MKFLAQLQNPPREFTAIPFWFLNGELTAEELRRQLADFAAHGIYGVVLHPRMGLSPDITYLCERYFAHIRTAVEAAAALDMKIVLYDEGMYPSGSACGLVVKDHPELASEGITLTQTVLPGDELLAQAENGALVVRNSGGTISIRPLSTHRPMEIGLSTRMPTSPSVIDSARRRFCSIMSPSTKPRISGAIGTPCLRSR